MKRPKIHILLATFNRAHLIGETLDSIISQTYANWECIIVDDFSSDNTKSVIDDYIRKDQRFHYYPKTEKQGKGLSASRNYGLDLAEERGAEFIQFFDDDDIMHPKKLELQIMPLLRDASIDLTICQFRKFADKKIIEFDLGRADDGLCRIETENLLKSFYLNEINLNSPGPLWRTRKIFQYRFLEELQYAEEKEFYLRIFLNENIKYVPVKYVLFWYRKHDKAITANLYNDPTTKLESLRFFEKVFFQHVLDRKKPPFFLMKSYAFQDIKKGKLKFLPEIVNHISSNKLWSDGRYLALFLFIQFELFVQKVRSL